MQRNVLKYGEKHGNGPRVGSKKVRRHTMRASAWRCGAVGFCNWVGSRAVSLAVAGAIPEAS